MIAGPFPESQALHCAQCLTAHQEAQLTHWVERSPSPVAMFDRNMRYLASSRRWRAQLRIENDPVGQSQYDIFPEITEHWKDIYRRALAGENLSADRELFLRTDGSRQWLRWEVLPWRRPRGDIGGIVMYAEDTTECVLEHEKTRQSEAQLRAVGDSLPDSAIFQYELDQDGRPRFLYLSAGLERITGLAVASPTATCWCRRFSPNISRRCSRLNKPLPAT